MIPSEHVSKMPGEKTYVGQCPECAYSTGRFSQRQQATTQLQNHWDAHHLDFEPEELDFEPPKVVLGVVVPNRPANRPALVTVEDDLTALDRIQDLAFDTQIRRLTEQRKWAELEAAFLLHGSTLANRYHEA